MITINVPGKLMLVGEWSILQPGNSCIVMAVNKYLTAILQKLPGTCPFIFFSLPDLNLPIIQTIYKNNQLTIITQLNPEQKKLFSYCRAGAEAALNYINLIIGSFQITITSELSTIKHKLGFGGSAASIVATIKILLTYAGYNINTKETKELIFNLAIQAHNTTQGINGSGFDIAIATYGTTLLYENGGPITTFKLPSHLTVLVGFSGASASTSELILAMEQYKKRDFANYQRITSSINILVKKYKEEFSQDIINQNRMLLLELANSSGIELETPALTKLINIANKHGAAAKFSGAGGGDCGIALCPNSIIAEKIKHDWLCNNIVPIDVKIL